jgi:hypothetical protein
VLISFDRTEQLAQARFACRVLHFRDHIRGAASRTDEPAVEDAKIDLLIMFHGRSPLGPARSQLILNNDFQKPTIAGMNRRLVRGDTECTVFLQWALPLRGLRWPGFRKVRRLQAARRSLPSRQWL